MAAFEYSAIDINGKERKGVIEADNARMARIEIRRLNLIPIDIQKVAQAASKHSIFSPKFSYGYKISAQELVLFTRQLATLVDSGLPIEEALLGVAEQSESASLKKIIMSVRSSILEGHNLSHGLASFPQFFSDMYRATVSSGEESGKLANVLERLADYTQRQYEIRQKISSAIIYPSIMLLVSAAVVVFLLIYVVPQLVTLFEDNGQDLPWLTNFVINTSEFIKKYGYLFLIFTILSLYIGNRLLLHEHIRYKWHALILKIPFIGKIWLVANIARFARTFAILSASGVPILEAVHAGAKVVNCLPIRKSLFESINKIREGKSINQALVETKFFPPMSIHLIAIGEKSGRLDAMLTKAAYTQEMAVEAFIARAITLFEPCMTLIMGAVILLVVLSVLLPIFQLSQQVA